MKRLVDSLLDKQLSVGAIKAEEIPIYRYGYTLVLEMFANILIAIIIGIITGWLGSIILFLIAFIPLRTYCGGYHGANFWKCLILSNALIVGAVGIVELGNFNSNLFIIAGAIGVGIILLKAPCQWKTKPISNDEVKKYRRIILLILAVGITTVSIQWNYNPMTAELILLGYFVVGLSVMIGGVGKRGEKYEQL